MIKINNIQEVNNSQVDKLIKENEREANIAISKILLIISGLYILIGLLNITSVFKANIGVPIGLFAFAFLFIAISLYCLRMNSNSSFLKYVQLIILLLSVFLINCMIGYRIWMLFAATVLLSVRYYNRRFTSIVGCMAMGLCVVSAFTNAYLASYFGILDLNVVSFNEPGKLDYYSWLFNAVLNHGYDEWEVAVNGLRLSAFPNCLAILITILVCNSVISNAHMMFGNIGDSYKKEISLLRQAMKDGLTDLYNRRAYEKDLTELSKVSLASDLVYISMDVNGLKVINDTLGHMAGDELILGSSECMRNVFKPYGKVYRIGGDEFVAILNVSKELLNEVLSEFDNAIDGWSGELIDKLSISYGVALSCDFPKESIRVLSSTAEKRMYKTKSEHYRKQGVDRRGQQDAHKALCELYTKILRINLTEDSYQIVNMDISEQTKEKGFSDKISDWLYSFGKSGQVHPDDVENYLNMTELNYMKNYFMGHKTSLQIFYRRKYENGFKKVMMEIIPTEDYSDENQSLFLYVKNIDI